MWGMWWNECENVVNVVNECDQCGEMETEHLEQKKLQAIL
jgi:hypothetical protein